MGGMLLLEDGRAFEGEAFGASTTRIGEIVFNTSMTGYQEVLTDPSYREQIVTMTVSHVGNYGVNEIDMESAGIHLSGFIVRELSRVYSNWRAEGGLHPWLRSKGIPGVQRIDTRALVRHIREKGAMRAAICTDGTPKDALLEQIREWPGMEGRALAAEVSCAEPYVFHEPSTPRMAVHVLDGGVKLNILRLLAAQNCAVRVFPAMTPAEQLREGADAVFLSNGPGDPAALPGMVDTVRACIGELPVLGICLGHQLLSLALGADTFKLRFGHRGGNHPVKDQESGKVLITSQNHGFSVDPKGIERSGGVVTHTSLYDGTLEGFRHDDLGIISVQFHPEAAPGPHDAHGLMERFLAFGEARL